MKKGLIVFAIPFSLILVFAVMLTSAGPYTPPVPIPGSERTNFKVGLIDEPSNLNPLNMTQVEKDILILIYDSLARLDNDSKPAPWVAEHWDVNNLNVTIKIRENMKWHDGLDVSAEDVNFTYNYIIEHHIPMYKIWTDCIEEIKQLNDTTIRFILSELPGDFFNTTLRIPLLPQHIWQNISDPLNHSNIIPIGCGAFIFHEWVGGESLILKQNINYFMQRQYVYRMKFLFYSSMEDAVSALEAGEVDFLNRVDESYVTRLEQNKNITVVQTKNIEAYRTYRFEGWVNDGEGIYNIITFLNLHVILPASPFMVYVNDPGTGGKLIISWIENPAEDIAGYTIYRSMVSKQDYRLVATLGKVSSWVDMNVTDWTTYYYVITTYDDNLDESMYSIEVSGKPTNIKTIAIAATAGGITFIGLLTSTEFGKYGLLKLFFLPLYTRIKRERTLDHFLRGQVYEYIRLNQGAHYTSIKKHIGVNNGALTYHLQTLERQRFIKSKRDGRLKRFYPMGVKIQQEEGIQLSELQTSIIDTIRQMPGITQKEIAGMLNTSHQVVGYNINHLAHNKIIRTEKEGRKVRYYLISEI
jgi:predicted transcriptional regulator